MLSSDIIAPTIQGLDPNQVRALVYENEQLRKAARFAGVCMTCVVQAPEPYGCSDCLNTGLSSEYHHIQQTLIEARRIWLEEFDPQDGTDCVTPFDKLFYGGHP